MRQPKAIALWVAWAVMLAAPGLGTSVQRREPQTWVVAVGIDSYQRPEVPKLKYACADARLMAQAWQDLGHVPPAQIRVLTSDAVREELSPTLSNVVYYLSYLRTHCQAGDTVIFYFAGHGVHMQGQGFLLTVDSDSRTVETLRVSSLRAEELLSQLHSLPDVQVLSIFDACRNDPTSGQNNVLSSGLAQTLSSTGKGAQYATLFSCNLGERSWEWPEKRHGIYTFHLAEGLQSGAVGPDGRVTLASLTQYVYRTVPHSAQSAVGASQVPIYRYEGTGLDRWELAKLAVPTNPSLSPAEQSRLVNELDAARLRLDQAEAEKRALSERLALEESQRLKLEASLALLEQRTRGLPPTRPSNQEVLQAESEELKAQNTALQARIRVLELKLAQVGMAPSRSLERLAPEAAVAQLQRCLETRPELLQPADARLAAQVSIYGNAVAVLEKRLTAAEVANKSVHLQLQEAEAALEASQQAGRRLEEENTRLCQELLLARAQGEEALARLGQVEAAARARFPGHPFDAQWNRITRRARNSDIVAEPNTGPEAQRIPPRRPQP